MKECKRERDGELMQYFNYWINVECWNKDTILEHGQLDNNEIINR